MNIHARRYDTGQAVNIACADGRIASIQPLESEDESLPHVAPAFLDLQVNGFGGQDFTDPSLTVEHVEKISLAMDEQGCGGYCPTVTTQAFDVLAHSLRTIASVCERSSDVARRVVGLHVEGPYICAEDGPRGAHPVEHCRPPDWDEFQRLQEAADGRIRILTLSPDYEGSAEFIRKVADTGVVVAIGHTAANTEQIEAAVDAGARLSTHLGNGAHSQIKRHPNYIWDQLAEDRLWASLIADGHHLPPAVVKSFLRGKTPERCLLVSDITGMAGMPPGDYPNTSLGDIRITEDGRIVVAAMPQYLAGASLPMTVGVANLLRWGEVDMATAIDMASLRPAQLMGLDDRGRLEADCRADLILFSSEPLTGGGRSFELQQLVRC